MEGLGFREDLPFFLVERLSRLLLPLEQGFEGAAVKEPGGRSLRAGGDCILYGLLELPETSGTWCRKGTGDIGCGPLVVVRALLEALSQRLTSRLEGYRPRLG